MKLHVHSMALMMIGLASSAANAQTCYPNSVPQLSGEGFYTDSVTYAPGQTLSIHGNWDNKKVKYFVRRANAGSVDLDPHEWPTVVHQTSARTYGAAQNAQLGSFIKVPALHLSDWDEFTIEGWFWPSYTNPETGGPTDFVVLAGQASLGIDDINTSHPGGAWIGIDEQGRLCGGIRNTGSTLPLVTVTDCARLELYQWHYVALTFKKSGKLRLFRASPQDLTEDSCPNFPVIPPLLCATLVGEATTGPNRVPSASELEFRIGARSEAPGSLTGCADGRFDRWGVWSKRLTKEELQARMNTGRPPATGVSCTAITPLASNLQLEFDFEQYQTAGTFYPYFREAWDSSGHLRHGEIVNHGTPGMAGPTADLVAEGACDGKSLRLNHDQLVDAGFNHNVVTVALPGAGAGQWQSGLYVVQAVFEEPNLPGTYFPESCINRRPEHFATFVVKPAAGDAAAPIAIVVPVNTWMAYNSWPGSVSSFAYGLTTASAPTSDMRQDLGVAGCYLPQGNNSVYTTLGDGVSTPHFTGWRRPNTLASPVLKRHPNDVQNYCNTGPLTERPLNDQGAYLAWKYMDWVHDPFGVGQPGGEFEGFVMDYDLYSDWDLDDGSLALVNGGTPPTPRYQALMIFGKPEYYSQAMLDKLDAYVKTGGSILSVGGNSFVWRSEPFSQVTSQGGGATNKLLEMRKWPESTILGLQDARTCKDDSLTGEWRFVQQQFGNEFVPDTSVSPPPSGTTYLKDYVLGTLPYGGSGYCNRGYWRARDSKHWLWGDDLMGLGTDGLGLNATLTGVGQVVGLESDAYLCSMEWAAGGAALEDTLPVWTEFPFSIGGKVSVLADGDFIAGPQTAGCVVWVPNYGHPAFASDYVPAYDNPSCGTDLTYLSPGGINMQLNPQQYPTTGFGSIVYYKSKWGGKVLNIASIDSVLGLRYFPKVHLGTNDAKLSNLALRALRCMLGVGPCTYPIGEPSLPINACDQRR